MLRRHRLTMNHPTPHPLRDRRRASPPGHPHASPPSASATDGGSRAHPLPGGRTLADLDPMEPDRRVRAPLSSHSYLYELKLTGMRMRALVDHGQVALLDANGCDCGAEFAHITNSLRLVRGGPHVLDGVCTAQPGAAAQLAPDPRASILCVFDLLFRDGRDVTGEPLLDRKQLLSELLGPELPCVIYMNHFEDCGRGLWHAVSQLQLDGVMARRKDSAYRTGARSGDWRVIGRATQEAA